MKMGCVIKLLEKHSRLFVDLTWIEWGRSTFIRSGAIDRPISIICPFSNYSRCTCPWAPI